MPRPCPDTRKAKRISFPASLGPLELRLRDAMRYRRGCLPETAAVRSTSRALATLKNVTNIQVIESHTWEVFSKHQAPFSPERLCNTALKSMAFGHYSLALPLINWQPCSNYVNGLELFPHLP